MTPAHLWSLGFIQGKMILIVLKWRKQELKKKKKRLSCGVIKNSVFVYAKFRMSVRPTNEDYKK